MCNTPEDLYQITQDNQTYITHINTISELQITMSTTIEVNPAPSVESDIDMRLEEMENGILDEPYIAANQQLKKANRIQYNVIMKGREKGYAGIWMEVAPKVNGVSGNSHVKCDNLDDAKYYLERAGFNPDQIDHFISNKHGQTSRVWDFLLVMKSGCAGGRGFAPRPGQ